MERSKGDIWVGLFVVAGLVALLVLAMKVGNLSAGSFDQTYVIKARFDNIGGLKVRAPVKSAGVVVGRVASVDFDPAVYQAVVSMRIDSRFPFPRDTFASILTSGLLGEQYIGLEPGGDDQMLKDGEAVMKAQSAIVLEKLITQFLYGKAAEGE